ncbi:MAG: B12-binding domain-containing radical SAM protein [Chloroflexi bacterium]|nr:B12-binding domain-containing radical SAM protein [Chloroflexota bacterium]
MRVLLVNPQSKVWTSPELIHLGLAYIAGALEELGHTVRVYDGAAETEPYEAVLAEGWDVVGVTATTPQIADAWLAVDQAKATGALTIMGGPHPTIQPLEQIARPSVDLVVRGEGEQPVRELFPLLEQLNGRPLSAIADQLREIRGLTAKLETGEIIHNPDRPFQKDLSRLPRPAFHLFKVERYSNLQPFTDGRRKERSFTIMTSRGCPHACTFCSRSVEGRTWRPRKIDEVIAEWRWLIEECGATEIGVADDVWNLHLARAKELCRALIAHGLNRVPWVTIHGMRADATDEELFFLMKQAGCKRVGFGVESGNQAVLDRMKKKQTLDQVRQAMRNAKKAGLQTMGFFIFGMPGDTEETMEETIRFAIELDPDLANFMIATPYPGTELYDIIVREGQFHVTNWEELAIHSDRAHFSIGETHAAIVEKKWHEAYRRFYLRPSRLWRRALMLDTWLRLPYYLGAARRFFLATGRPEYVQSV